MTEAHRTAQERVSLTREQVADWLLQEGDRCAAAVADAYAGWDTDVPWSDALLAEIEYRRQRGQS